MVTNSELHALAKAKGLLYETSKGPYHAYVHITADDTEGLDGRSPEEYNVTIMTTINPATEQAAREAAKVVIKELPIFEKTKKKKKVKKTLDKAKYVEDNADSGELESQTEKTAKKNLASRLF